MTTINILDSFDNNFNINNVDWQPYYVLAKASIGQIMVTFLEYNDTLSKFVRDKLNNLNNEFLEFLTVNSLMDKNVIFYNLIVNLPKGININNDIHGKIKLENAKMGALIHALKNRIHFIINRELPDKFNDTEYYEDFKISFKRLQDIMVLFLKNVISFEKTYVNFKRKQNALTNN